MAKISEARKTLVRRVLEGPGTASHSDRQAAFANRGLTEPVRALVEKVALHAWRVTDEDIQAVRASGLSEDQIFEIAVCAAVGESNRQMGAALAALAAATGKE